MITIILIILIAERIERCTFEKVFKQKRRNKIYVYIQIYMYIYRYIYIYTYIHIYIYIFGKGYLLKRGIRRKRMSKLYAKYGIWFVPFVP